jgi:hypothetical protein
MHFADYFPHPATLNSYRISQTCRPVASRLGRNPAWKEEPLHRLYKVPFSRFFAQICSDFGHFLTILEAFFDTFKNVSGTK